MKKILVFCILLSVSFSSVFAKKAKIPLWASELTIEEVYPSKSYIAAIGTSNTSEGAIAAADAEISGYFSKAVVSSVSATETMVQGAESKTERELKRTVNTQSSMELFALNHTESYYDKKAGKYYVCAYIDRNEAWEIYEPRIKMQKDKFYSAFNSSRQEKDTISSIRYLAEAIELSKDYEDSLLFGEILNKFKCSTYSMDRAEIAKLDSRLSMLKKKVYIGMKPVTKESEVFSGDVEQKILEAGFAVVLDNPEYVCSIKIDSNKVKHEDTVTCEPKIFISITRDKNTLFTYSKQMEKISCFLKAEALLDSKLKSAVNNELGSSFLWELNKFILDH